MDSDDEDTTVIYQTAADVENGAGKKRKSAVDFDNRSDRSDGSGAAASDSGTGRRRTAASAARDKADEAFEGEFGYALVRALRGKTVGRRMRRALFKFGFIQLFCGIPLFIMTCLIFDNFRNSEFYDSPKYGLTLMELMWMVSFPTFILGLVTMTAVKNWASLVTNRKLLSSLTRCYMVVFVVMFMFTLWMICVTFLAFQRVDDWGETVTLAAIFPYYVCTIMFGLPYLASQCYYLLDLSYLVEELDMGGTIAEPDPPDDVMDLSDVTLLQSCLFVFAMPCILCIQCFDLLKAMQRAYQTHYKDQPFWLSDREKKKRKQEPPPKKKRRVLRRIWKTLMRMFRGTPKKNDGQVQPEEALPPPKSSKEAAAEAALPAPDLELAELTRDREEEERRQRELAAKERESLLHQQQLQQEQEDAEKRRQEEAALIEAARLMQEQRKQQQEAEAKRKAEEAAFDAALTVAKFKALWTSLGTAGSFQCNLKALPELKQLSEHLKKCGFHVVFASQPSPSDMEIGVCNVRKHKAETWFMARFLATPSNFSAVMKAEKTEEVTGFVKKFALAKVLKIQK